MSQVQPKIACTKPATSAPNPVPSIVTDLRGVEGLNDLLGILGASFVAPTSGWRWRLSTRWGGGGSIWNMPGPVQAGDPWVEDVLRDVRAGARLSLDSRLLPRGAGPDEPRGEQCAQTAVTLTVPLAPWLARPPTSPVTGEGGRSRIPPSRAAVEEARGRLLRFLGSAAYPPTRVLDHGDHMLLVYAFRSPLITDSRTGQQLWELAAALAAFVPSASARQTTHFEDLAGLFDEAPAASVRCRVLRLRRARVWDPVELHGAACGLLNLIRGANPPPSPNRRGPPPAAMALRTLPPAWHLDDLAVPAALRNALAAEATSGIGPWTAQTLRELVEAMAERGHGWLDVDAVLADPRWCLGGLLELRTTTPLGLKRLFRAALPSRQACFPTRLPYGLTRIERLPEGHPGERRRYRLRGRNGGQPFSVVVDWDTLMSPRATARAVERVLEVVVPWVPATAWRTVLAQALDDPRVTVTVHKGLRPGDEPLTAHITRFLAKARALEETPEDVWTTISSRSPSGWPMVRAGVVVFPRPVLEDYLRALGIRFRRSELTRALESLGGGPRGVECFPGIRRIRTWFCPIQPVLKPAPK